MRQNRSTTLNDKKQPLLNVEANVEVPQDAVPLKADKEILTIHDRSENPNFSLRYSPKIPLVMIAVANVATVFCVYHRTWMIDRRLGLSHSAAVVAAFPFPHQVIQALPHSPVSAFFLVPTTVRHGSKL